MLRLYTCIVTEDKLISKCFIVKNMEAISSFLM